MRSIHLHSIFFAAALAAATLAACSNEDNAVAEPQHDNEILFTATLAPKGGDGDGATRSVDANGKTKWVTGEQIAIYYETTKVKDGSPVFATKTATVTANTTDGTATFNATLTDAKNGGAVSFVYPATLNDAGDINLNLLRYSQKGTLDDLSANFDAATASATLVVNSEGATVSGPITMQNRVCICKFSFRGLYPADNEDMYNIIIKATEGTKSYYISNVPAANTSAVYVAMLPTKADFQFDVQGGKKVNDVFTNAKHYEASYSGVTLAAGNFYTNVPIDVVSKIYKSGEISETVTVLNGQTLVLSDATINAGKGPGIKCEGDATIILEGVNTVITTATGQAGIQAGTSLTISGSGSLTATGGTNAAGIGASAAGTYGNITISGGTIKAIGGNESAGIGTGYISTCGTITISGGTVEATGGGRAAGIGSGIEGNCGDITISGNYTHIKATKGNSIALCSIGKGSDRSTCGTVKIGDTVYPDGVTESPFSWPTP